MIRKLTVASLAVTACVGVCAISVAQAGTINAAGEVTYPSSGTENPANYTFTVTSTGAVDLYFVGSSASDDDELLGYSVNGGAYSTISGLNNQTSTVGEEFSLGSLAAGSSLTFELVNTDIQLHNTRAQTHKGVGMISGL